MYLNDSWNLVIRLSFRSKLFSTRKFVLLFNFDVSLFIHERLKSVSVSCCRCLLSETYVPVKKKEIQTNIYLVIT